MYKTSMKHSWIHKFPFESVISLAIMWKAYLKFFTNFVVNRKSALPWRKLGRSHWSQFSLVKAFLFPQKGNWVFFWTFFLYLRLLTHSTLLILLREKNSLRSLREMVRVHEEKSSCINYSVNIMTSCTRNLARAPSRRLGVPRAHRDTLGWRLSLGADLIKSNFQNRHAVLLSHRLVKPV